MKNKQLLPITIILAIICCGLIFSSFTNENQDKTARYHLFFNPNLGRMWVYDAVSGDYKQIQPKKLRQGNNLKALLEN